MLEYLFSLLPPVLQRLLRPEVDDLIATFTKLETKMQSVVQRHATAHSVLNSIKEQVEAEIEQTAAEIERAKRIAGRVADLVK